MSYYDFQQGKEGSMKIVGVIPARFASSRFPGKPLADIQGKPMIWWVYQQAVTVPELDEVYVATDDIRIANTVKSFGGKVVMTSNKHPTGTDRVAEVAESIFADWYVNIQGDEPLIESETIQAVLRPVVSGESIEAVNLMTKISNPNDIINPSIVKVIVNEYNRGIYLTRGIAPFPKERVDYITYKSLGIYAFKASALLFFKSNHRGRLECIEDIEMLRLVENGIHVRFVDVNTDSVAVDTENDLEKVRLLFNERLKKCVI